MTTQYTCLQLPTDLYEEVSKELSSSDAWRKLAVELGIMETKDLNLWTYSPHKHIVINKWKESGCTWQQLVAALTKIGHKLLAAKIETACRNEY